ncbi:hypothetical protein [Psychrosphaera algicola]|uniref:Uncharacterized protein n=1 Tax=Psychrosphaera algicola TaxID=3023714 RepID=A0ABT5FAF2_9GAMM|nr:hypothetical protein [Psychrosphaera sp. G1-22]MDC2888513.1 hypothetical protein [Psychrosphaera sp. G1-22]
MNKQLQHHVILVTKLKTLLIENNVFNDSKLSIRFEVPPKRTIYHLIIHGLSDRPICIKTAYADSVSSNQALRYPAQMEDMPKDMEVWFIRDGLGFRHERYKRCIAKINKIIGVEQVMTIAEFKQRIVQLIKKPLNANLKDFLYLASGSVLQTSSHQQPPAS